MCLLIITGMHSLYAQNKEIIYNEIEIGFRVGDIKSAIQKHTLFKSRDELKVECNSEELESVCNLARVNLYYKKRNFEICDSLLVLCKNSILYANDYYKAYCCRYEGLINYFQKHDRDAFGCFLMGYSLFIQQGDTLNALKLLKNSGIIYMNTKNYNKAEEIFNKSLLLARKINNKEQIKSCLLSLGGACLELGDYEKSLDLYLQLNRDFELLITEKAALYNSLGVSYLYLDQYEKAKICLDSSLVFNKQIGDETRIVNAKINLAKIALHNEEFQESEELLHECMSFDVDSSQEGNRINVYYNLIDLYSSINERDSLLKYIKLYTDANNKVRDNENQRALLELSAKYESAQKDQEIALLNNQNKLRRFEVTQQKILMGIITVVAILAIFAGIVINGHRRRLAKAKNELKTSNEAKDRILSIIGHDLRGPVGGLKSLMEIYMELPILDADDIDKLLKSALDSSTSTYFLLENLLTWANAQRGQIVFNPKNTSVYPIVVQIVKLLDQSVFNRDIRFFVDVDKQLTVNIDVDMFMSILRNLITNAIKFSPDKSVIVISAKQGTSSVSFSVQDEGVGMDEDEVYKLFTKKEAYYLENSKNAKGSGLGLILCKEFVEYHGGVIWAKSIKGKGSWFYFKIPNRTTKVSN